MSCVPTEKIENNQANNKDLILAKTYRIVSPYFKDYKNPKVFLFLMELVARSLNKNERKIFFNILEMSYEFEVCEKTIKSWLKQLENLNLISFNFKKQQLYFVELTDYQKLDKNKPQSQSFRQVKIQTRESQQINQQLPTRFYKNVRLILNQLIKSELKGKAFRLPTKNEQFNLLKQDKQSVQSMTFLNNVLLKFENSAERISILQTYEQITGKTIPPLSNPHHKKIIKANLKHSLRMLIA